MVLHKPWHLAEHDLEGSEIDPPVTGLVQTILRASERRRWLLLSTGIGPARASPGAHSPGVFAI